MNPEFRQTLNTISHNLESANQAAQENIYTFTQLYIDPCLEGFKSCVYDCTAPCFPRPDDHLRRNRGRSRGRAEYNFDFYDDWEDEQEADNSAVAWGDDELDSLLAGRGQQSGQPKRQRAMSYGSRGRRKPSGIPGDEEQGPTIIPGSSYLGFLERLPWKLGSRVSRYRPSAADLQENPGRQRLRQTEEGRLTEEGEDIFGNLSSKKGHGRQRSDTVGSRSTTNSLSSRGDLIMSDEEEDAVPLDEEFAVILSRRITNTTSEDQSSGKTGSSNRPGISRRSTRTVSSKSGKSAKSQRSASQKSSGPVSPSVVEYTEPLSMIDLKREEEQVRRQEELEIEQKREAAQKLAIAQGLSTPDKQSAVSEVKPDPEDDPVQAETTEITAIPTTLSDRHEEQQRDLQSRPSENLDQLGSEHDTSNIEPP